MKYLDVINNWVYDTNSMECFVPGFLFEAADSTKWKIEEDELVRIDEIEFKRLLFIHNELLYVSRYSPEFK